MPTWIGLSLIQEAGTPSESPSPVPKLGAWIITYCLPGTFVGSLIRSRHRGVTLSQAFRCECPKQQATQPVVMPTLVPPVFYPSFYYLLVFTYLKGRVIERRERKREIFYYLIRSPGACNSQNEFHPSFPCGGQDLKHWNHFLLPTRKLDQKWDWKWYSDTGCESLKLQLEAIIPLAPRLNTGACQP